MAASDRNSITRRSQLRQYARELNNLHDDEEKFWLCDDDERIPRAIFNYNNDVVWQTCKGATGREIDLLIGSYLKYTAQCIKTIASEAPERPNQPPGQGHSHTGQSASTTGSSSSSRQSSPYDHSDTF